MRTRALSAYIILCNFFSLYSGSANAIGLFNVCVDDLSDSIKTIIVDSVKTNNTNELTEDTIDIDSSVFVGVKNKSAGMAIGQGIIINTFVWSIDKWILKRPYCSKGWETLKDNIKKGLVWDCDALSTNFFDHPFHGAQYYNAARVNGFNFYQSTLFALLGSFEWEEIAETDFPAPNDFFSTTIGGSAFGEVTYRLSNIILNNRKRRLNRLNRELLNCIINPTYEVNRILYGEPWMIDNRRFLYHDKNEIPYNIYFSIGSRWTDAKTANSRCNLSAQLKIEYGKWADIEHNKPFDQFLSTFVINPPAYHIPFFSDVNINARLYGWSIKESDNMSCVFSINQDFSYFNNEKEERYKGDMKKILHLAEPSSFGPALYLEMPNFKNLTTANLAFIGAYTSDYYYRGYNMGSGFNVKTYNNLNWKDKIEVTFDAGFHLLFTWKGYEKDQIKLFQSQGKDFPYNFNTHLSRKAGDQGYVTFFIIKPRIDVYVLSNVCVSLMAQLAYRNSVYTYHNNINSHYVEYMLSLTYKIK